MPAVVCRRLLVILTARCAQHTRLVLHVSCVSGFVCMYICGSCCLGARSVSLGVSSSILYTYTIMIIKESTVITKIDTTLIDSKYNVSGEQYHLYC